MSRLLALSFDTPASPSITLKAGASSPEHPLPAGWGMAWYPPGDRGAMIVKDPGSVEDFTMARLLKSWSRFRSTIFLCQLYGAAERRRHEDTQPFVRIFADRQLALSHNGYLTKSFATELPLGPDPAFEPLGHTDSEHLLCWLLNRLRSMGLRRLPDLGWSEFHQWLREVDRLGTLNLLLTDGDFLVIYQDADGHNPLHVMERKPPHQVDRLEDDEVEIDLGDPLDQNRTALVVSTQPFASGEWRRLEHGEMLVVRHSEVVWRGEPAKRAGARTMTAGAASSSARPAPAGSGAADEAGDDRGSRELEVRHVTVYRYERPVEVSQHALHLRPVSDRHQEVLEYRLDVSPQGFLREYDDVFGNETQRLDLDLPFTEMRLESRSVVRVSDRPLEQTGDRRRSTIPMPWMPWQREMMAAYLLPAELPAPQLQELSDYAMSFAERQDFDLIETLQDINRTLYRDWAYQPGITTLETTPWEVYVSRRGVCQDFANLLICMSRLLGIPARYRVGYLFAAGGAARAVLGAENDAAERVVETTRAAASHAWAELYLPHDGWRGFDPTNGCLVGRDHVRVACGRNFRDAAPTSGTIYRGGGRETLEIEVHVELRETAPLAVAPSR